MKHYGVPYQGSKQLIAEKIVNALTPADTFYDLFAGGCAITHCAMLSGKYKRFVVNDISPYGIDLFLGAIQGKYKDEKRWISREDFFLLKETDPYVRLCWSFSNDQNSYLYGKDIEPYKKAVFDMCVAENGYDAMIKYRKVLRILVSFLQDKKYTLEKLKREIDDFNTIVKNDSIERVNRVNSCKVLDCALDSGSVLIDAMNNFKKIKASKCDYRDVEIEEGNAVLYCDIPYKNTTKYKGVGKFNYEEFYTWAEKQIVPCYISEYSMPKDRFVEILSVDKRNTYSKNSNLLAKEKLFVPKAQVDKGIVVLPTRITQGSLV